MRFRLLVLTLASTFFTHSAQATPSTESSFGLGQIYYITADFLNARSTNSINTNNVLGKLSLNDQVELIDLPQAASALVQVRVVRSAALATGAIAYVSRDYLGADFVRNQSNKYFVIQNVATEKTRVYERCFQSPDCPHKMVMETDMIVGRPESGTKHDPCAYTTWLGHAKISEWVKFYQDGAGHYPHWYKEGQSLQSIPKPITQGISKIASSRKWLTRHNGSSTVYGAFGWYAAKITPGDDVTGMNYQWLHGTIGWGSDGSAPVELTRGFLMNLFTNPASAGCTRLENRAIAYLRHLLPVGTDIYRVYAMESKRSLALYQQRTSLWDYALLTDGAQKSNGLTADAKSLIEQSIPIIAGKNLIERGQYEVDQYPTPVALDYTYSASSGKSGDRYRINTGSAKKENRFKGYFLVDEGRLVNYQHPRNAKSPGPIRVSGLPDFKNSVPDFLATQGRHVPPEIRYK